MSLVQIPTPQRVRKVGNSLVVTIPADVADRYGIKADDLVAVELTPLALVPRLAPDLEVLVDEMVEENREAFRYLRDH
ncbi:MAG: AbrB/MazE/SpoVT family DNA-binding domain-containing protein [Chloroflexi bacterium]|nr:AbrB/MazE/SpoVT family DNA-binding domain-containing protein [Chloroflexota bacterium]